MTRSDRVESQAIGSYLRLQRGLRAISVEELANLTRIPVRSIERLEAGCFDGQVDGFSKGFVRTVAESLGLDAEDTLARMLSEPEPEDRRLVNLKRRLSALFLGLGTVALLGVLLFVVQHLSTRQARTAAQAREEIVVLEHLDAAEVLAVRALHLSAVRKCGLRGSEQPPLEWVVGTDTSAQSLEHARIADEILVVVGTCIPCRRRLRPL